MAGATCLTETSGEDRSAGAVEVDAQPPMLSGWGTGLRMLAKPMDIASPASPQWPARMIAIERRMEADGCPTSGLGLEEITC